MQQAMIEKYRQCDATIVDMVDRVSEIERRLAEQEPVSENANGLRNQINTVKVWGFSACRYIAQHLQITQERSRV